MERKGEVNSYTCVRCSGVIWTEIADDGTTPMMIGCRATEKCPGHMRSDFYQEQPPSADAVQFEWYKPKGKTLLRLSRAMREHVSMGGLVIRKKLEVTR